MMELSKHESFGIMGRPTVMAALLLGPTVLGVLCYIWAFYSKSQKLEPRRKFSLLSCICKESKLRGVQNVYDCLLSFLFSDVINAAFAIVYAVLLLQNRCNDKISRSCTIVNKIGVSFRYVSLTEHLITALILVLYHCHPGWATALRYISRFLIFLAYVFVVLLFRISGTFMMILNVYNCLLIGATVLLSFTPLTAHAVSQRKAITFTALATFLCICLPNFVIDCFQRVARNKGLQPDLYSKISDNIFYATNFHIFMDGLMCYFVLKLEEDGEQPELEGTVGST